MEIKTIKNITEFQKEIDGVRRTKQAVKVKHEYDPDEEEASRLNMEGIDVIMYDDYQEIIPI